VTTGHCCFDVCFAKRWWEILVLMSRL
jgi:hypothetical protein